MKNEHTSAPIASLAAAILRNPKASRAAKRLAGSALTQARDKKRK
jgi:hypothetical protein